jgi:SAM-dependent methyltransferase
MQPAVNEASTGNFEFEALKWAQNYRNALVAEFTPHLRGQVFEIGAGIGQMTGLLARTQGVTRVLAVEPDPRLAEIFRQRLPENPLLQGTAKDLAPDSRCECIVSVNVLEHIQEDLRELEIYARLLRADAGTLCLFVPARPEIYAPLDQDFGHYRRYTRKELRDKLKRSGFEILRINYFNLIGYFAWWFNFRLLGQRHFNVAAVRFFDRMIFPPMHAWESRILRPPIGQSLIVLARTRA